MSIKNSLKTLIFICVLSFFARHQAIAEVKQLTLINRSGAVMTLVAAAEKIKPNTLLTFTIAGGLAVNETDIATIDLPVGVCLVDIFYQRSDGVKIVQPNVDLCGVESLVVE